jgi:uncharacterized membrane protein YgdD (TMEM256/DUF423 family)
MSYVIVIAAVVAGLLIGAGAMIVGRRSGQTHEQSVQRQRIVQYFFVVFVAVILSFDAIDTPRHRWLNAVVLALMAGGLVFDRIKARRHRTMP